MFVVVTIFGVWLGWNLKIVRERKAILSEIKRVAPNFDGYDGIETCEAANNKDWMYHGESFSDYEYQRISFVRRLLGDESCHRLIIPESVASDWIVRAENAFDEAELGVIDIERLHMEAYRDSLYAPANRRQPNQGTVFETGLIEK